MLVAEPVESSTISSALLRSTLGFHPLMVVAKMNRAGPETLFLLTTNPLVPLIREGLRGGSSPLAEVAVEANHLASAGCVHFASTKSASSRSEDSPNQWFSVIESEKAGGGGSPPSLATIIPKNVAARCCAPSVRWESAATRGFQICFLVSHDCEGLDSAPLLLISPLSVRFGRSRC